MFICIGIPTHILAARLKIEIAPSLAHPSQKVSYKPVKEQKKALNK